MSENNPSQNSDFAGTDPQEIALTRRRLLRAAGLLVAGGSSVALSGGLFSPSANGATKKTLSTAKTCSVIPPETGGPFPGDGSNGANVLTEKGVVRRDIRGSFGSATGRPAGIDTLVTFSLTTKKSCAPLVGAAFYAWHCDADGNYSMYTPGTEEENFLRGVQVSDSKGQVTFLTTFPGAYQGRWPHIHFEVYSNLDATTSADNVIATSQLAFPAAACTTAYAAKGYEASRQNFAGTSIERDGIFRDSWKAQTAVTKGSVAKGFTAMLNVTV
jgi:protocatechuate 3,4-dioxygenase beta subunit